MSKHLIVSGLAYLIFIGVIFIGVYLTTMSSPEPTCKDNTIKTDSVLVVIDALREAHPNASEVCIVVAANIAMNNFDEVAHMMSAHGRCATKLLGLRVTKDML